MNLSAGRFLVPTRLKGLRIANRLVRLLQLVSERLGSEVLYCDDIRVEDLPADCPFVLPLRPVQWCFGDGFRGLLSLPRHIKVFGFWDDIHQGKQGPRRFHRDHRILMRFFRRADLIISSNRHPFLQWYPRYASKLAHVPMFFTADDFASVRFNPTPLPRCILSGAMDTFYPFRRAVSQHPDVVVMRHPGYGQAPRPGVSATFGAEYAETLSRYRCGMTCGSVLGYVVAKYMELPAAGCLLLAPYLPDLDLLGFQDRVNYLRVDETSFDETLGEVLGRPEAYEGIRRAGFDMVRSRHSDVRRAEELERLIRAHCAVPAGT